MQSRLETIHSRNDVVGECEKHPEEEDYFTVSARVL